LFEQELYGSVQGMVDRSVEEYRATSQSKTEETIRFDLTPLLNNGQSAIILFEILKPFGFNSAQIQKIHQSLEGQPGKRFISATHLLYLGRKELLIRPISETPSQNHYLDPSEPESFHDAGLLFELIEGNTLPQKSSVIACLDYDLLEFPLLLRQWKPGDSFCPLGMTGRKKISDFLIDIKASPIEKENIRVLFSGDQVIWIEKIRIDHRVRVTNITRKMLIIKSFE
jgi:tRNA(Ile)-lysidine synthase